MVAFSKQGINLMVDTWLLNVSLARSKCDRCKTRSYHSFLVTESKKRHLEKFELSLVWIIVTLFVTFKLGLKIHPSIGKNAKMKTMIGKE